MSLPPPGDHLSPPATSSTSSGCLEIRLFYVRVSTCGGGGGGAAVPRRLTLSRLAASSAALPLRLDRHDRAACEATYVSTAGVRVASAAAEFEVADDRGVVLLCGTLERLDSPWSNGAAGWAMDCFAAASAAASELVPGATSPTFEVYVAGCYAGGPVILTQAVQLSPRQRPPPGGLDAIPEGEEVCRGGGGMGNGNGLVRRRPALAPAGGEETDDDDNDLKLGNSYCPERWCADNDDGQLSWFNAGVRVGVGIGLGMCVGIGIGVGLLMRSYQATTRSFKRRFF